MCHLQHCNCGLRSAAQVQISLPSSGHLGLKAFHNFSFHLGAGIGSRSVDLDCSRRAHCPYSSGHTVGSGIVVGSLLDDIRLRMHMNWYVYSSCVERPSHQSLQQKQDAVELLQ